MVNSSIGVYRRLFLYIARYRTFGLIGVLGIIIFSLASVMQYHLVRVVTNVLANSETSEPMFYLFEENPILWVPIYTIVIFMVRGFGNFLNVYFIERCFRNSINDLRIEAFSHLLHLPKPYFDSHSKGTLLTRLTYNIELIYNSLTRIIVAMVRESITLVFTIAYMFILDWRLAAMFMLVTPIAAVFVNYVNQFFRRYSKRLQTSMGSVSQIANEAITGISEIKTFTAQQSEISRFRSSSDEYMKQNGKLAFTRAISVPIVQIMIACVLAIILAYAISIKIEVDVFVTFLTCAISVAKPLRTITSSAEEYQKGAVAAEEVFAQIDQPQEPNFGTHRVTKAAGKIEFIDTEFKYDTANDEMLFKKLNLTIHAGESVALVGKSGSGKSTLVAMINRFYEAENPHSIRLDAIPLNDYDLTNLRQQIALVAQNTTLINGSIRDNIQFANPNANHEQVEQAAKDAHLDEFTNTLELGLDTQIGDNGVALSGGQRQRIAIARAIVADAPILILDEATSALDTESERYIQQALNEISKNRTTIIVAHRLSTIEHVDRIVVMDQGEILEMGTHQELIALDGQYKKLVDMQYGSN